MNCFVFQGQDSGKNVCSWSWKKWSSRAEKWFVPELKNPVVHKLSAEGLMNLVRIFPIMCLKRRLTLSLSHHLSSTLSLQLLVLHNVCFFHPHTNLSLVPQTFFHPFSHKKHINLSLSCKQRPLCSFKQSIHYWLDLLIHQPEFSFTFFIADANDTELKVCNAIWSLEIESKT